MALPWKYGHAPALAVGNPTITGAQSGFPEEWEASHRPRNDTVRLSALKTRNEVLTNMLTNMLNRMADWSTKILSCRNLKVPEQNRTMKRSRSTLNTPIYGI